MMEEATRLFYVGMTRAKQHLELITYKKRDGAEMTESRFMTAVRNIQDPPKKPATSHPAAVKPRSIRMRSVRKTNSSLGKRFTTGPLEQVLS